MKVRRHRGDNREKYIFMLIINFCQIWVLRDFEAVKLAQNHCNDISKATLLNAVKEMYGFSSDFILTVS